MILYSRIFDFAKEFAYGPKFWREKNLVKELVGYNNYQKPSGRPFIPSLIIIYSLVHHVYTKRFFDAQMHRNQEPSRHQFFYIRKTIAGYIQHPTLIHRTISKFDVAKNFALQNNVRGSAFWNESKLKTASIENFHFGNFAKFVKKRFNVLNRAVRRAFKVNVDVPRTTATEPSEINGFEHLLIVRKLRKKAPARARGRTRKIY